MEKYILGNIRKVIYRSPNGLYTVGIFKVRETNNEVLDEYVNRTIGFTGELQDIDEDIDYVFYGDIIDHPKYGLQFSVSRYEIRQPNDLDGLVLYLSSGLFKGIGTRTAKKIVEKFGEETIKVIKNDYDKLALVSGMTIRKAEMMHNKIMENEYNEKNQEKAISPSNSDIGKILNIPYHRVNAFLSSLNKKYGKNYKNKLSC